MHVGVKEAVAQRVAQEGLDHGAREALEVEALGLKPRAVGQRRGVDPFERQHVARGAVPVHRGHAEVRIVAGVLRHLRERGGLEPQIHLERDRAAQRVDHLDQAQPPRLRRHALGVARGEGEGVEIDLEAPLDARPQHLHRDGAAPPSVTTSARCTCAIEAAATGGPNDANRSASGRPNAAATARSASACGNGAILSCSDSRSRANSDADHVRPRRQELAELDVGRPEPGQRGGEPVRGDAARRSLDQPRDAQRRAGRQRQPRGIDQAEHALAREHETGAAEAGEMGQPCDHNRQPECSATMPPVMRWNETRAKPAPRIISANASGRGKRRIDSTR